MDQASRRPDEVFFRLEHLMTEIQQHPMTGPQDVPAPPHRGTRTWNQRPIKLLGAAAAAAVVATVGTVALSSSPDLGQRAFAVSPGARADEVSVRIVNTAADADQMTDQLHAQGIDVTIQTQTASPQLVGTWLSVASDGTTAEKVYQDVVAHTMGYTNSVDLPRDVSGLTLVVAVPTANGEAPAVTGERNAFAPGAALACSAARGQVAPQAVALLQQRGYQVNTVTYPNREPVTPTVGEIATAAFFSDDDPKAVDLVIGQPEAEQTAAQLGLGFPPAQPGSDPTESVCS